MQLNLTSTEQNVSAISSDPTCYYAPRPIADLRLPEPQKFFQPPVLLIGGEFIHCIQQQDNPPGIHPLLEGGARSRWHQPLSNQIFCCHLTQILSPACD